MSRIKGLQIRAARAILRWRAEDLAEKSQVGVATIRRAEAFDSGTQLTAANEDAVRRAFESAGIKFIDEAGGAGVYATTWQTSIFD
ncbi:MAG: DNA-binding protein [Microvirga sp.]|nr:DNA-binding protein [Microvirga sp.]